MKLLPPVILVPFLYGHFDRTDKCCIICVWEAVFAVRYCDWQRVVLLFAACTFPLFYILKPGYITTAVIIGFIVLSAMGPPVVLYLAEQFSGFTNFIMNLSIPVLYTGSAVLIMFFYLLSWGLSTVIYQRKVF